MTAHAVQAGVRGHPLTAARERAHDCDRGGGGRDDRARAGGALERARSLAADVRCGQRRTRARRSSPRRPTRARSRELPGVAERGAPVPVATATVGPRGSSDRVFLAGLSGRPAVNTPVLTTGSPLREGGIVLERSFARALGIEVGATLELTSWRGSDDRRRSVELPVLGTAVVPSQARYPRSNPGLAWVTRATLGRVEPDRTYWRWTEALRLANPAAAAAFTGQAAAGSPDISFETWQDQRDNALGDARTTQVIVTMFTILLLIVAFVVVGILVGARVGAQHREIGLLKAAGFTPRQVGAVFALESAALGLVAAALGFALGDDPCTPACRAQRRNAARLTNDRGESLARPRCELFRPSRARSRSLDVNPPQHPLHRARGDTCGQLVPAEFTPCARRRPIRHALDDRARAQRPACTRTEGASPRGRDRVVRRGGGHRALGRRLARRATCRQDQRRPG